jgi:hypothetical protein
MTLTELQNFKQRANRLYWDGYRASVFVDIVVRVQTPRDTEAHYVDLRDKTCDCYCYNAGRYRRDNGQQTCKHIEGIADLLFWAVQDAQNALALVIRSKRDEETLRGWIRETPEWKAVDELIPIWKYACGGEGRRPVISAAEAEMVAKPTRKAA